MFSRLIIATGQTHILAGLILSLATSMACGSASDTGSDGGSDTLPPVVYSSFIDAYAGAICAKAFACCTTAELETGLSDFVTTASFTTEAECTTAVSASMRSDMDWVLDLVTAGDLLYDGQAAATCFAGIAKVSCETFAYGDPADDPACEALLTESVPIGGTCHDPDVGCAGNWETAFCDIADTASSGTCAAMPAIGAPCGQGWICDSGAYCESATTTCAKLPARGEPCPDWICADGLFCPSDAANQTTACAPLTPVAVGDSCAADGSECVTPAFCELDAATSSLLCMSPRAIGEPCSWAGQCQSYECDASGKCVAPICDGL